MELSVPESREMKEYKQYGNNELLEILEEMQ